MLLARGRKFVSRQPRDGPDGGWRDPFDQVPGRGTVFWGELSPQWSLLRKVTLVSVPVFLNPFYNGLCIIYTYHIHEYVLTGTEITVW